MYLNEHFKNLEKHLELPSEAVELFEGIVRKIENDSQFSTEFKSAIDKYMNPEAHDFDKCSEDLNETASRFGVNEYSLNFVFLLVAAEIMHERYKAAGLGDSLFYETISDMRFKFKECVACKEAYGTFVTSWYTQFYNLRRFAMGRFQFEFSEFSKFDEYTTSAGVKIKRGDKTLGFHIPSSGVSLTDDVRLDSYKKAYEFFKDFRREDGLMIFECGSWLLYDKYKTFLPENSNIVKFIDDFEIIDGGENEKFNDAWRIYGKHGYETYENWPENTSLQRAFKKFVSNGNKTGHGHGIIVFDGEKIVK